MLKHFCLTPILLASFLKLVSAQTFNSPESVEFDPVNNQYIVSNTNGGQLLTLIPGQAPGLFTNAVSAPYGLAEYNSVIYVCDNQAIKGYDLNTANEVFNLNISGSTFLNGICSDGNGFLYVTDFSTKKIYSVNIAGNSFTTAVSNTSSTPNGILYDELYNRLVFCTWGANAKLISVSLPDYTLSTIKTTGLTNIDGVVMDKCRNFMISEWGGDKIYKIDSSLGTPTVLFSAGINNPADIFYNALTDTLAVPNTGSNQVSFFSVDTCVIEPPIDDTGINENETSMLDIIATQAELLIRWKLPLSEPSALISVTDLNGKTVYNTRLSAAQLSQNFLSISSASWVSSVYILSLRTNSTHLTRKVFIPSN